MVKLTMVVYHLHGQSDRFTVWANGKQISVLGNPFRTGACHLQKSLSFTKKFAQRRRLTKTKSFINKRTTLHVRYFWYISLPFSAQIQLEMTKFKVLCRTRTHSGEISFL